jgi:hypothetical protein
LRNLDIVVDWTRTMFRKPLLPSTAADKPVVLEMSAAIWARYYLMVALPVVLDRIASTRYRKHQLVPLRSHVRQIVSETTLHDLPKTVL